LALKLYLDASAIFALILPDAFSVRGSDYLDRKRPILLVSDFAKAEFASAVALRVRRLEMSTEGAREAFAGFDAWTIAESLQIEATTADIKTAEAYIRRLDLNLRAPDAINIAITQREGATLMTFDARMAECARALGVPVADA
jgi:predicted nucleic acid-binding protein